MTAPSGTPGDAVREPDGWWGWDPDSVDEPPLLPDWPWHDNTGLWRAEDREALQVHEGDFITTSHGQVIDRMDIRGRLFVVHRDVTVKRSWIRRRIENSTPRPVQVIHCDVGDGAAGDYTSNGVKGVAHVYRSNIYGVTDSVQTTPSRGTFIFQDNFVHDLRYATDPRVPSGGGHNDGFKADSAYGTQVLIRHNTFWSWTMNNMTEQETATRSSGPNWTDAGNPIDSVGNTARDGKPENGLQNAAVMIAEYPVLRAVIDGNLFRGHTYTYLNVQGGYVEVTNNLFAVEEHVAGRPIVRGLPNIDLWSNNTDYLTGDVLRGNEK